VLVCANSSFYLILVTIYETNFNARGVASNKLLLFFLILICNALMNQLESSHSNTLMPFVTILGECWLNDIHRICLCKTDGCFFSSNQDPVKNHSTFSYKIATSLNFQETGLAILSTLTTWIDIATLRMVANI